MIGEFLGGCEWRGATVAMATLYSPAKCVHTDSIPEKNIYPNCA